MAERPVAADRRLSPAVRLAPAKLNLTLAVAGRRPDGFHDLHSVMVPLALADRLSVAAGAGDRDSLTTVGFTIGAPEDNLVLRAISAARDALGRAVPTFPLSARLEKRIPVAAGLAGGSSDAAAAVSAALEAWGVAGAQDGPAFSELEARLARRLGSDVPFFLAGGPAIVTGRGEHVEALPALVGTPPGILLVTPDVRTSTADVFAALDRDPAARPPDPGGTRASSEHLAVEWRAGLRTSALLARAGILASANDLAIAADVVVPGLRTLRRNLVRRLGRPVGLSGSGPTLWVLYASPDEATVAAEAVRSGLDDGSIVAPGSGVPTIVVTTIVAAGSPPAREPGEEGAT
jgi:4-diphosphocytidyl-2-C-methyl-D-erythritol kinase